MRKPNLSPDAMKEFLIRHVEKFAFGLVVMPLNNAFSRWREWKADATALVLTGNPDGFIRAMRKLAEQNLAEAETTR